MRRLALSLLLLGTVAAVTPAAAQPKAPACPRTESVENLAEVLVSGTIYQEMQYGPPGYGAYPKTDRRDKIGILKLDDPLSVRLPFTEYHPDQVLTVKEIQIAPQKPSSIDAASLLGKHVVIKGRLFEPDNSDHVRPILIYASSGRPGGRVGCDGKEQAGK